MADIYHFSAPGRTEIGGNHTDHQHGCVLTAAVVMETRAKVTLNGTNTIRVDSEGYKPVEIDLNDRSVKESEKNTTAALIRGVAAAFAQRGYKLAGFDAKVKSTVLPGSGLSSSAAFEVLIGRILNGLFADNAVSAIEIAQIGQYAENVFFGKPCGLMDQTASSVGGVVAIDFADTAHPAVESIADMARTRPQVLILCPTRELAMQACEELKKLSRFMPWVRPCAVYGGASMDRQIGDLKRGANIVVGTPGRVMDHMNRRTLKLQNLKTVILDEADEMLNMGFREDIETIL